MRLSPFWIIAALVLPTPATARSPVPRNVMAHLESVGDVFGANGEWVGTKGQSRRLEAFGVELANDIPGLSLEYTCHLQDIGDTDWVPMGDLCGARGESRRLEGFAIRLVGPKAAGYRLSYRCHLQDIGDTGWMSGGAFCGTRGQSRRLEALVVTLTKK